MDMQHPQLIVLFETGQRIPTTPICKELERVLGMKDRELGRLLDDEEDKKPEQ